MPSVFSTRKNTGFSVGGHMDAIQIWPILASSHYNTQIICPGNYRHDCQQLTKTASKLFSSCGFNLDTAVSNGGAGCQIDWERAFKIKKWDSPWITDQRVPMSFLACSVALNFVPPKPFLISALSVRSTKEPPWVTEHLRSGCVHGNTFKSNADLKC